MNALPTSHFSRARQTARWSLVAIACVLTLGACGDNAATKQKELELKERELALKEQELGAQKKAEAAQQAAIAEKKIEKIVRKSAMVITQSGGDAILRSEPSKASKQLEKLYDSERITVIGETSMCEVIGNHQGCWVKVTSSAGTHGYLFDAFVQYN